jgi:hypothetical protein
MDIAYVALTAPDPAAIAHPLTGGAGFEWDGNDPPRPGSGEPRYVHREMHIGQSGVDRPGYRVRQLPQRR